MSKLAYCSGVLAAVARAMMPVALCCLLIVATAGTALIFLDVHDAIGSFEASESQLHMTLVHADETITQLRAAATNEQKYYDQGSRQMAGSFKALRLLIDRTDRSLNDATGTIPRLNLAIDRIAGDADQVTKTTSDSMWNLTKHSTASFDSLTKATLDFDAIVADPHTRDIFVQADGVAGHLNVIAANSEAMSGDMRIAVHRLASPPSKFHQFIDVSYTALKFGSLFVP